jgi:hypothetical protein
MFVYLYQLTTTKKHAMTISRTFAELTQGSVVNFRRLVTADDTNFVVLGQYKDPYGDFIEVLNLDTFEKESFAQHTKIEGFWSIIKEQV